MNAQVNELQVLEQNVIVAAFAKRGGTDELFERIAEEARSFVPKKLNQSVKQKLNVWLMLSICAL